MTLKGPDVSGWQPDFYPTQIDCDFVICKATGGVGFVSDSFRKQADDALANGKLLGVYHFAGDGNAGSARDEAEHFLRNFEPYIGKAIPILDWEAEATAWSIWWAKEWLDIVADRTGSTPWFYSYASYIGNTDCSPIADYPLWVAAYYAGYEEMGWQDNPPYYGSLGNWDRATAYQYTSSGTVGYPGHLDLNIFYGDRSEWQSYVEGDEMIAEQVWNHNIQGPNANLSAAARMVDIEAYLHDDSDPTGRDVKADMKTRIAWMAAKQEKQQAQLDAMDKKLDEIIAKMVKGDE